MIFDDHDVHDDWNISAAWLEEMRATDWWDEHCVGAMMSYWVYQHLGNLTPELLKEDDTLRRIRESDGDGQSVLRDYCSGADRERQGSRWSYCRDVGGIRLIMIDSRAGRMLEEGNRDIVDAAEWDWIVEQTHGDFDHLLLGSSLPYLLGAGMQSIEAWSEADRGGRMGRRGWRASARSSGRSSTSSTGAPSSARSTSWSSCSARSGAGEHGEPPASIVTLSGDVHHAYLFEIGYPRDAGVKSAIWQAVCSPYRNPLDGKERRVIRMGMSQPFARVWRLIARAAGVEDPGSAGACSGGGPWFDNQVATLTVDGRRMSMQLDKAVPVEETEARLERVLDTRLT